MRTMIRMMIHQPDFVSVRTEIQLWAIPIPPFRDSPSVCRTNRFIRVMAESSLEPE